MIVNDLPDRAIPRLTTTRSHSGRVLTSVGGAVKQQTSTRRHTGRDVAGHDPVPRTNPTSGAQRCAVLKIDTSERAADHPGTQGIRPPFSTHHGADGRSRLSQPT